MLVALVEVGPGVEDADDRLALPVLLVIAHLLGPAAMAEGTQVGGTEGAEGAELLGGLAGHCLSSWYASVLLRNVGRVSTTSSRPDPRAAVKLSDVAAAAGVAPMTVSRVLNTPGRVRAGDRANACGRRSSGWATCQTFSQGGCRPASRASLRPSCRPWRARSSPPALGAFTDTLDAAGYHVVLGLSGYGPDEAEEALVAAILGRRPDGPAAHRHAALRGDPAAAGDGRRARGGNVGRGA